MRMFCLFGRPFGLARKLYRLSRLATAEDVGRRDAVRRFGAAMAGGGGEGSSHAAVRAVGVSRSTLFRWRSEGARGKWRPDSRRPHQVRGAVKRTRVLRAAVLGLRRAWPGAGKEKLSRLFASGQASRAESGKRRTALGIARRTPRTGAEQWSGTCRASRPGERAQTDTLSARMFGGRLARLFVAQDMRSRMTFLMAASQATATSGARFLEKLQGAFPFRVESIQADGGGEFRGAFEQACQAAGVRLVILPPRSPRLNGQVESLKNVVRFPGRPDES